MHIVCFMHNVRDLPFDYNYNDVEILKALNRTNHKLGELNGALSFLPNPFVIFNAITLGEAKESSEIENIVTTFDELFKEMTLPINDTASKEVLNYRQAMLTGFNVLRENGFISVNQIIDIHRIIEPSTGDIRKIPGTVIKNTKTGDVIHTPPQSMDDILVCLSNLEKYINYPELEDIDPILKMAIIHFQFESIHPFYDGNGRTGRILNILYLTLSKKIDLPVLYLSKYINRNRSKYYACLNAVQSNMNNLKPYLLFMIDGVYEMSVFTLDFIHSFIKVMDFAENLIKEKLPKIYSQELVEHIFYDFYTKNEKICEKLGVSRNTSSKYLHELVDSGVLIEEKIGQNKIYKNAFLYDLIRQW